MTPQNATVDEAHPSGSGAWRWVRLAAAIGLTALALLMLMVVLVSPYDAARWVLMQSQSFGPFPGFIGIAVAIAVCVFAYAEHRRTKARAAAPERLWKSPARSAYVFTVCVWMALYALAVVNVSWVFDIETWPVWARMIGAIAPALPIGGVIFALLRYLKRETDEYQRSLLTRAVLIATGLTFFTVTAWGFLELYVGAPHFPPSLVMCPFWLFFGFSNWWVRRAA